MLPILLYEFYILVVTAWKTETEKIITYTTGTQVTRVGVVNAVYEARAIPGDHKQKEEDGGVSSSFGGGGGPAY